MIKKGDLKIAIVHDEFVRRGGAEAVVTHLLEVFEHAKVFSLYANHPRLKANGRVYPIHTSTLQRLPRWFRQHPKRLLPLLPYAAEQLDVSKFDVVISSASAFAKAIVTRAAIPHICYCHTPTRYLWDDTHAASANRGIVSRYLLHRLRLTDYAAAQRVDHFIANSSWTASRIAKYYRAPSAVIYPPVRTHFFTPQKQSAERHYFLCVGRLTPLKYFEHAITACEKLGLPLVIVGRGHHERQLKYIAGPHTTFAGKVSDKSLRHLYRGARALIQPGVEDFGLASAEALACGTPVVAFDKGGIREITGSTQAGQLYNHQSVEGLADALRKFITNEQDYSPTPLQRGVLRFGVNRFNSELTNEVLQAVEKHRTQ